MKRETRGDRTRAALVAAAWTRFAAVGFDAANGADIAADAGVSEPSIAHHFGSKRGLFIAVMASYYERTLTEMRGAVDMSLDALPRLVAFTRWWVEHLGAHRDLILEFEHHARPGRGGPDITDAYARLNGDFRDHWVDMIRGLKREGLIRQDVSSRVIHDAFIGATTTSAEHAFGSGARPTDEQVDDVVELVLSGAGAERRRRNTVEPWVAELHRKLDQVLEHLAAATDPSERRT